MKSFRNYISIFSIAVSIVSCASDCGNYKDSEGRCISGIYPHLAFYNAEGECGTGAVVPWGGNLYVMTYAPHSPYGSSDKLYRISPNLQLAVCPESVGGTPANRMIHRETGQLVMGPYVIDEDNNVKTVSYETSPGRYTGTARHLEDPESKVYIATMEEGFYELDMNTMDMKTLWSDDNAYMKPPHFPELEQNLLNLPGWHGKGLYSGQGVLVYSNNGEYSRRALEHFDAVSGSLNEWDGSQWKLVRRNQFTELTGPGGIYGNDDPSEDPIWALGFDCKSLLLGVREPETGWSFFRLPKASWAYDGAHGWNTEWPRIRNVGTGRKKDFLMTMHGMFWKFPDTFATGNTAGIRPRSAYLKVIGDFARFGEYVVMGCDDSAQKEFLNVRKAKGGIEGPGQSNSNLWFLSPSETWALGPDNAGGYVWMKEEVKEGQASDPFLFAGWEYRCAWLRNFSDAEVHVTFEADLKGNGRYVTVKNVTVPACGSVHVPFLPSEKGEWMRLCSCSDACLSASFVYSSVDDRSTVPDEMFDGLAGLNVMQESGALLYGLGSDRRTLGVLASDGTYYELDGNLDLKTKDDPEMSSFIKDRFKIDFIDVEVTEGSVLVIDDSGRRWRLPLGDGLYTALTKDRKLRICREVATERDLFNCHGTFYELPAENADGYAKIRPVASHSFRISDYASFRGLLVMSGVNPDEAGDNPHIVVSDDGKTGLWVGAIDDLWKLGRPSGHGGPWVNEDVKKGVPSDPYLMWAYGNRNLLIKNNGAGMARITVQMDPTGDGDWVDYTEVEVASGHEIRMDIPDAVMARWIRFVSDEDCIATAWLEYR